MEGLEKNTDIEQEENKPGTATEGSGEVHEPEQSEPQPEQSEPLESTETEPSEKGPDSSQVVPTETTVEGAQAEGGKQEALMEMYEESIRRVQEGEVVQGKIIQIDKEFVLVDIGYKSEGQVPIDEFMGPDGQVEAAVGDTIDIMVERWEDEDGAVRLSKNKASRIKIWDDIQKAYEEDGVVGGVITNRVKGGLSVDIGIPAFLPGSQVDLRPMRDLDQMVGKTFDFKVLKYNRKRSNIVLSRRVILEKEREAKRAETLATIHEGKVMDGVV